MNRLTITTSALLLFAAPALAQSPGSPSAQTGIVYTEGQPGPFYKPRDNNKRAFDARALKTMPQFAAIPPITGKVRTMGASAYDGVGSVSSATFEVMQTLPAVLSWYADSLKNQGWSITKRELGYSAHIYAKLPGQPYTIDIQLLSIKSGSFRTRVYAKEVGYQNVICPTVGGGTTIPSDQVPPLGMN